MQEPSFEIEQLQQLIKPVSEYHDEIILSLGWNFINYGKKNPIPEGEDETSKQIYREFGKWFLHTLRNEEYKIPDKVYLTVFSLLTSPLIVTNASSCVTPQSERVLASINKLGTDEEKQLASLKDEFTSKTLARISGEYPLYRLALFISLTILDFNGMYKFPKGITPEDRAKSVLNELTRVNNCLNAVQQYLPYVRYAGENFAAQEHFAIPSAAKRIAAVLINYLILAGEEVSKISRSFAVHREFEDEKTTDERMNLYDKNSQIFSSYQDGYRAALGNKLTDIYSTKHEKSKLQIIIDEFYNYYLENLEWFCINHNEENEEKIKELDDKKAVLKVCIDLVNNILQEVIKKDESLTQLLGSLTLLTQNNQGVVGRVKEFIVYCQRNIGAIGSYADNLSVLFENFSILEAAMQNYKTSSYRHFFIEYRKILPEWGEKLATAQVKFNEAKEAYNVVDVLIDDYYTEPDLRDSLKNEFFEKKNILTASLGNLKEGINLYQTAIEEMDSFFVEISRPEKKEQVKAVELKLLQQSIGSLFEGCVQNKKSMVDLFEKFTRLLIVLEKIEKKYLSQEKKLEYANHLNNLGTFAQNENAQDAPEKESEDKFSPGTKF